MASNYSFKSVIFDLDGIITKTALIHAAAWKGAFDEYLHLREKRDDEAFREFTHEGDYLPYVDGKPRYEGVKSFLESRNIHISYGEPTDPPGKETICGLGNRKNTKFIEVLREKGAEVYPSTIELIKKLIDKGIKVGVASSSKNCKYILESAHIESLFETRVDGVVSVELNLKGKPQGDIFVKAAFNLGTLPKESIVVEDATSGVLAGRNGGFGLVLGVARENNEEELLANGADLVVSDLSDINLSLIEKWFNKKPLLLLDVWEKDPQEKDIYECPKDIQINPKFLKNSKSAFLGDRKPVFFLDYDGTLTPIVSRPELAVMSSDMRSIVKEIASKYTTAIVSGRAREDVQNLVKIEGIFYAGSHGFDIKGPDFSLIEPKAESTIPLVSQITKELKETVGSIEGVIVEHKKFSVALHYRLVNIDFVPQIKETVYRMISGHKELRIMEGKKVFEILPAIDWNKGKAIRWIMQALNKNFDKASVIYIGDDTTDEDAFRVVRTRGVSILVSQELRPSAADFLLSSPKEVEELFEKIIKLS